MFKKIEITGKDIDVLNTKDEQTLAEWYCLMNRWGWPDELDGEPHDRDLPLNKWKSGGRRSQLMSYIQDKVGHRLVSRTWNKDRMTDDEFNDFYAGTFEGDNDARNRYEYALMKRIEFDEE